MRHWIARLPGSLALAALLSGCSGTYLLDNSVQSFSGQASFAAPPTYRFERLPSQQASGQTQLEAMADPALYKAGLRRDDANPHYSVQVNAAAQRVLSPWVGVDGPWGWGPHPGRGFRHSRLWWDDLESPWFQRQVSVIVRELPSNRVVFESHATNDGPSLNSAAVFPAMFEAAMQGFPNPPPGPRQVAIQLGR